VRLQPAGDNRSVLELGPREKELLLALLKRYPCVPPAHQRLSKAGAGADLHSAQRLLDDALAEQRARNKRQVQALFADPGRWIATEGGWKVSVTTGEIEWLLQVLNDVRVGSWLALGSPEQRVKTLTEENAPHLWAMEMSGSFEMALLHLLEGRTNPDV
jgi:hypothetical protein